MRTFSDPLEQHAQADLEPVAEEGGLDLRVDHPAHRLAHEQRHDLQVLPAAVQDDRDIRVAQDREQRRQIGEGRGVEDGGGVVGRDLHDAERRAVGPLPHELRVQGESSGRADLLGEVRDLGGGGQERGGVGHGAPQLSGQRGAPQPLRSGQGIGLAYPTGRTRSCSRDDVTGIRLRRIGIAARCRSRCRPRSSSRPPGRCSQRRRPGCR